MTLLTNWLSKEDFKTIEKNKKKYDSLSKKELTELKNKKTQEYIENFKNLSLPSIEKDSKTFYHLDSSKISTKKRDSLKKIFLKIYSINCLINKETPLVLKQPLSFIFDNTNLGVPRAKLSSDIYVHPEEKASRCFGCFVKEDIHKMRKLEKEFSKKNLNQIFKLKKEILQELNSLCSENKTSFENTFSQKELDNLKAISIKYHALNNVQKEKGVFTKNIETLMFTPKITNEIKKGDYIDDIGLVINKIKIQDEDYIITYINERNNQHMLKMFNLKNLKKNNIWSNFPLENTSKKELNKMNNSAQNIIKDKKVLTAHIGFTILNKDYKGFVEKYNKKENKDIQKIFNNEKYFYFIHDFLNIDRKKNSKAGKILGIQLLKLMQEKDLTPIFLEAINSFGSKHSPVSLYLRAGFTPYTFDKKTIEDVMNQNNSEFPTNVPVLFYLKDFSENKKMIDSLAKIYQL